MSNSNSNFFLYFFAVAAAAVGLIFFVILPQLSRIAVLREQITESREHAALIAQRISEIESARVELGKVANEKDIIKTLFPKREEMAVSVEALESAVSAAGAELDLQITDLLENPAKGVKPPATLVLGLQGMEEVPFVAKITSDFSELYNILRFLENSRSFVKLGSLAAAAEQNSAGENQPMRNTGAAFTEIDGVFFIKKQ